MNYDELLMKTIAWIAAQTEHASEERARLISLLTEEVSDRDDGADQEPTLALIE